MEQGKMYQPRVQADRRVAGKSKKETHCRAKD